MAGNSFGEVFKVTTFGESHGEGLGCIIDGCPAGIDFDFNLLQNEMDRRKAGVKGASVTARKEDDKAEDKKEEKAEEPDEKLKDGSDLTDGDKANLKDSYKKAFKATMLKLKYDDKCFDDLDLQQKVDFFTELSTAWKGKADPKEFMSDKEVEALEKIVVKR